MADGTAVRTVNLDSSAPSRTDRAIGEDAMSRRFMAAIAAASVAAGLLGAGSVAAAAPLPGVAGAGKVTLPAWFGDAAGDSVVFALQARGSGAGATGTLTVVHIDDAGGLYAQAKGDVTCLTVAGGRAVATGIVRQASFRDFPWDVSGTAFAITVDDRGTDDRLGFDFEFFEGSTIPPCAVVEPFAAVEAGNFNVR
jgi:hypothetical protein